LIFIRANNAEHLFVVPRLEVASTHSRSQLDGLAVDNEAAVTTVVNGFGILLCRIDPGFEHFQNEEIVFVH
jgi:hypothetical protein